MVTSASDDANIVCEVETLEARTVVIGCLLHLALFESQVYHQWCACKATYIGFEI